MHVTGEEQLPPVGETSIGVGDEVTEEPVEEPIEEPEEVIEELPEANTLTVQYLSLGYSPNALTINQGDTINFVNQHGFENM